MNVLPAVIFVALAAYASASPATWAAVSGDYGDSDTAPRVTQGACAAHERRPWVIAHRGASGTLPEHTLEAYRLAIRQGADFIEPDLVPTSDGALIARHERALAQVALDADGSVVRDAGLPRVVHATTNVADLPEFADRLTVKTISGRPVGGWFSDDFTLAEIGRLRARERVPAIRPDNALSNDRYRIATWPEILDLAERASETSGRSVGLMPELKFAGSPGRTSDAGARLIADVKESGFGGCVVVQSFEPVVLFRMRHVLFREEGLNWPLVQLVGAFDSPLPPSHAVFPDVRDSWQHARDALLDDPASDRARLTSPTGLDWLAQTYARCARHRRRTSAGRGGYAICDARRVAVAAADSGIHIAGRAGIWSN